MYKIEEIKKLNNLLNDGAISEDEFVALKKQIISNQKESISSENSNKQNDLLKTRKYNLIKNVSYENAKETKTKKKQSNVWQKGNEVTGILFILGILLSVIAGLAFWEKFNFISFLILSGISITGILLLGKVNKVLNRNLYLALISVGLFMLIFIPKGNHDNSSSKNSSNTSNSISEQKAYMKCMWCKKEIIENENENGISCYTNEPDGIGMLIFYGGDRYDVCCSENCATNARLAGYGYTKH